MAELFGKTAGCSGGKGGSMHLGDPDVGMVPAIAIVAGGNSLVTGIGLSFKLRRTDQVAVCFFGEGATNEGAFHEGLNLAAVRKLPIVFVCENNLYGASTHYASVSPVAEVARRVEAYDVPATVVDGMDVRAVRSAAQAAVDQCRRGEGPVFLECMTYRFTGHSRSDARGYRSKAEEAEWQARDPIPRLERELRDAGAEDHVRAIRDQVEDELENAVAFARAAPWPAPETALEDIYA
jgi:TPP-dependent pyruvate/acetoin dehydrogenase alpha subunit